MSTSILATGMLRELILPPSSLFLIIAAGFMLRRRWPRLGIVSGVALMVLFVLCTSAGARLLYIRLKA